VDTVFLAEALPTWKAVEYGLELVKKGMIWRIGPRSRVQIWRDLWIAREPSRKLSVRKGMLWLWWVSQLMVPGQCEWNESLLKECRFPHDVNEVLMLRLSERIQDDQIAWLYERPGIFTVRSAYKVSHGSGTRCRVPSGKQC
jgi:hypothetical protein